MEFLKSVAAVKGRLVTSVMLSWPSGHISFRTGFELLEREKSESNKNWAKNWDSFLQRPRNWTGQSSFWFYFLKMVFLSPWLLLMYLLYIRRLKSWKRRSLFLSRKPSTEYLQHRKKEMRQKNCNKFRRIRIQSAATEKRSEKSSITNKIQEDLPLNLHQASTRKTEKCSVFPLI